MGLSLGNTLIKKVSLGTTPIRKISKGDFLIWEDLVSLSDSFGRTAGTDLGSDWEEIGNDLGINASGQLAVQGTSASPSRRGAVHTTQTNTPFQWVQFKLASAPNSSTGSGAILRVNAAKTEMFLFTASSTGWNLGRISGINGTFTSIMSFSGTVGVNTVFKVTVDENNRWRVYANGERTGGSVVDATWADSSHLRLGLHVQRVSTTNSAALDDFAGGDTPSMALAIKDDFDRAVLGGNWLKPIQSGGTLYLDSNEISGVNTPSTPISFVFYDQPFSSSVQYAEAKIRWHGRNPEHSASSVAVRANPGVHHGVHFWITATQMGLCTYTLNGTGFVAATGTNDFNTITKYAENSTIGVLSDGITYTGFVNGSPVIEGTFTTAQVPLTNMYCGIQIQDDFLEPSGGDHPGNLDEFRGYARLAA